METVITQSINEQISLVNTVLGLPTERYSVDHNKNINHIYANMLNNGVIEIKQVKSERDDQVLFESSDLKHISIFLDGVRLGICQTKMGYLSKRLS